MDIAEIRARERERKSRQRERERAVGITPWERTETGRHSQRIQGQKKYRRETGHAEPFADFVGVDGEGGNDVNGDHQYYLLRVGDQTLETGEPLVWQECLEFLSDLDPKKLYVAFFFDYDVAMMLRGMPPERLNRLMNREERTRRQKHGGLVTLPLDVAGWQIDYLPKKSFKVRRSVPRGVKPLPWVEISDVGTFFQTAFVKVLADWNVGTPEERDAIGAGKDQRAEFGVMTDEIRKYNALECVLLAQLMTDFREVCHDIHVMPSRWQGPGQIATALLRKNHTPRNSELPYWDNDEFKIFANATYYGGRFETSTVGPIPGTVYNVDINSAYPNAMQYAPCLIHGRWEYTGTKPKTDLYMAFGTFRATEPAKFFGLPFRNRNGNVSFPADGQGWYWSFEIAASVHQRFAVVDSWSYHKECDCQPFDWIEPLYRKRKSMGKSKQGKALKLAINSLYGKTAQRIGNSPYNNLVWSSFITAWTRTQLQTFIHSLSACQEDGRVCGDDVYMLATDGIFSSALPADFSPSGELGGWELSTYDNGLFIVQSGLYLGGGTEADHDRLPAKTRGIPRSFVLAHENDIRDAFGTLYAMDRPEGTAVKIPVALTAFIGLKLGLSRNKSGKTVGRWVTGQHNISFDWSTKRIPDMVHKHGGYIQTYPHAGDTDLVTRPYDKNMQNFLSGLDAAHAEHDQPDWSMVFGKEEHLPVGN